MTSIAYGGGTTATYDKHAHTLTVSDGSHTGHLVFHGHYTQDDFALIDDGAGGTLIYQPLAGGIGPALAMPDWPLT